MDRILLAIVGAAYLGLGVWCSVAPDQTSEKVGFTLKPGSGQSEFLTVYGGLEFGLGLMFLLPLLRNSDTEFAVLACLIIHACLVLFRTMGFVAFSGIEKGTYFIAAVEWLIFLTTTGIWVLRKS